jgi:hypothetical protein
VPELFAFTLFMAITLTVSLRSAQGGEEGACEICKSNQETKKAFLPLYSLLYSLSNLKSTSHQPPTQLSQLTLGTTPYTTNMVQWTLEKDQLVSIAESATATDN